ncbi:MAG: 4-(cytidine 5'-diphospho)-2-C-methyl-D-erythritol kinase, partial [Lachnospiraceae bacterium]|nr:4-(cytidine 5'-diphospho)-2-C-methyl-D-erythritol kinase [Lachnospiraceae bacterium]
MEGIRIKAPAKINLMLDILDKRPDGFHEIVSVMQTVSLYDEITAAKMKSPGIEVHCDAPGVPEDAGNTAYRAAEVFIRDCGIEEGIRIDIKKRIPVQAGLAGGSTDAAAVLRALNIMYGAGLSREELERKGALIGSDVPFCIRGGTAVCTGRGEKVFTACALSRGNIVIIKPGISVSTAEAYRMLDDHPEREHYDIGRVLSALEQGDLDLLARAAGNSFQSFTEQREHQVREAIELLKEHGACLSVMSGSGPSVFGIFEDP